MSYLPYQTPTIISLLSIFSFIFLLNAIRYVLDHLLYCGIVGEILIGVVWGAPVGGDAWLSQNAQETIQLLGYLGLIAIVFQGGMSTDFEALKKGAILSVSIATIGLLLPIALSFVLLVFPFPGGPEALFPTPLGAFSAGASLCSTSLGTTFAILSASNLQATPAGVLLIGAAMLDDVVGLVMVNIVTMLGSGEFSAWSIARPIVASFGLLLTTLLLTPTLLTPLWIRLVHCLGPVEGEGVHSFRRHISDWVAAIAHLPFLLSLFALICFVTIASYIDASELLAAFLAGGVVRILWDASSNEDCPIDGSSVMYTTYYQPTVETLLAPFFFVSRSYIFLCLC